MLVGRIIRNGDRRYEVLDWKPTVDRGNEMVSILILRNLGTNVITDIELNSAGSFIVEEEEDEMPKLHVPDEPQTIWVVYSAKANQPIVLGTELSEVHRIAHESLNRACDIVVTDHFNNHLASPATVRFTGKVKDFEISDDGTEIPVALPD